MGEVRLVESPHTLHESVVSAAPHRLQRGRDALGDSGRVALGAQRVRQGLDASGTQARPARLAAHARACAIRWTNPSSSSARRV